MSTAGVLRLRALRAVSRDKSARRFAQDDAFFEGTKKYLVGCKNAKRSKKSQALRMTKVRAVLPSGFDDTEGSTAGPSTSLRSGRDDNSYFGMGCECPRKIVVLIKKSQALRMTILREYRREPDNR